MLLEILQTAQADIRHDFLQKDVAYQFKDMYHVKSIDIIR